VLALENFNLFETPAIKHVHFIGIGGISMSGLAEMLLNMGYKVTGSDARASAITQSLERMGINIYIPQSGENIKNPDLVVHTAAVKEDNPELIKSRSLNIPVIDRAELLGEIMRKYPYSINVSGTHGKTTTTSMIATIMLEDGLDPTIHIGGQLNKIGGTTKIGGDKYFVAEADEYCASFLKFHPYLAVILNIDFDHADFYRDINHIKETFFKFASLVPPNGYVIACADDANVVSLLDNIHCSKVTYGLVSGNAEWSAKNIVFDDLGCATYTLLHNGNDEGEIELSIPGIHNINNSLAAIAACRILGCNLDSARQGLRFFKGAGRRFELKGISDGIKVIDDYAHHPTEIKATLKAARNVKNSKVWCVFQPHTYSRVKSLMDEFAASFEGADFVILHDIYAAREVDNGEVNSKMLADKINENGQHALYIPSFEEIAEFLEQNVSPGDMIITMGAGDVYKVGELFLKSRQIPAII
jgi:UDP-N-acetylmuramate--alanine ligase